MAIARELTAAQKKAHRIVELADTIETDIHNRSLQPGDRYLSTAETAKMLRVDTTLANRTLQLLAKRKVIRRCQRVGSVIADLKKEHKTNVLRRVHLLLCDRHPEIEGWLNSRVVMAIQNELPGVRLQFHIIPSDHEKEETEHIINEGLRETQRQAFILIRSSLEVQRLMEASKLFAVIWGHPYASIKGIPYIDRDQKQIGRLMAEYLVMRGHKKILMLMRERLLPGDHLVVNAARDFIDEAGLSSSGLIQLCLPQDPVEIRCAIEEVFDASEDVPGIMVRPPLMAEIAQNVIEARGLMPMRDVGIVASDFFENTHPNFAVIRPTFKADHQGALTGRLVAQLFRGETPAPENVLTPVRLEIPEYLSE